MKHQKPESMRNNLPQSVPLASLTVARAPARRRHGLVLAVVLVVVAMLALGAYSFAYLMGIEAEAAQNYGRQVQARELAKSGIDYTAALLADQKDQGILGSSLWDDALAFQAVPVSGGPTDSAQDRGFFSIVVAADTTDSTNLLRFGLADESGKLNLNALPTKPQQTQQQGGSTNNTATGSNGSTGSAATAGSTINSTGSTTNTTSSNTSSSNSSSSSTEPANPLLNLPNMTPEIAAAMLDWLDSDDSPRTDGAESEYYLALTPPYSPKNGPLDTLDELLLVRGVTPRLLYGEDANQNGVLDANEDDGAESYPSDNADGLLDRGWLPYLTLMSRSRNVDSTGQPRVNLNGSDLQALYDQLSEDPDFGPEKAKFIIFYRQFGPVIETVPATDPNGDQTQMAGGGDTTPPDEAGSSQTIPEPDFSNQAQYTIEAVVDLIGASVETSPPDGTTPEMKSPFLAEEIDGYLDILLDRATTRAEQESWGQINVNTAPWEVLMAIPDMAEDTADAIVANRPEAGGTSSETIGGTAWLLTNGTLTRDEFKKIEPYITGRSFTYRIEVVGFFGEGGPTTRLEATVDVSGPSPRIRSWRELDKLGRAYEPRDLMGLAR
jgi:type II secretory pathway component PulK